jgi:phosphate transport system protein
MSAPGTPRLSYRNQIEALEHDLLSMGSRAEVMVGQAVESLANLDVTLAHQVFAQDDDIDAMDLDIEAQCLRIFALQQPAASDLRTVSTVMKLITDIERVADLAVDLARITLKIDKELGHTSYIDLRRMAGVVRGMFRMSLEAFVRRDLELVQTVGDREDEADAMYRELREQIFENMRHQPESVVVDGWLLLAVHHVERIADHACNVAERVHFMVTGEPKVFSTRKVR